MCTYREVFADIFYPSFSTADIFLKFLKYYQVNADLLSNIIDVTQVYFKLTTGFFIFVTTFQTLNNDWKPKKKE